MRILQRCDRKTKRAGEGLAKRTDGVEQRVEREELGAAGTTKNGLDKRNLDVWKAGLIEYGLDGIAGNNGIIVDEGVRLDGDGDDEGAKRGGFSCVDIGEGIDCIPIHLERIEFLNDLPPDGESRGTNRVVVNGASGAV